MPDVGTTLASWSNTSASNSPSGGTTISTGLDDNLREIQGVLVRGLSHKGADIASATTTDLGAVEGLMHDITGTTTITGFGTVRAGIWKVIKFEGALTLTHNATSLILPGGANITTANGDVAGVMSEGSGNWRVLWYVKADGLPIASAGAGIMPQGRITLTTAVPVTTSNVTGATTVYYTPYQGNKVPIYNGTSFADTSFSEVSQATTDNTKSPAAVAANKVYDLFVWSDSGTVRCTRGPAWTNDTTRGYNLTMVSGVLLNESAITNGPAASRGTYVGTIYSDASSQINDSLTLRHVWNSYNQLDRPMLATDTTDTWTYTTDTWRQARATTSNQVDWVQGLSQHPVALRCSAATANSGGGIYAGVGIGISSTSVDSSQIRSGGVSDTTAAGWTLAQYKGFPGVGRNTGVWLERSAASGTTTWRGDGGSQTTQSGITGEIRG